MIDISEYSLKQIEFILKKVNILKNEHDSAEVYSGISTYYKYKYTDILIKSFFIDPVLISDEDIKKNFTHSKSKTTTKNLILLINKIK
jgi:hypothetical protein